MQLALGELHPIFLLHTLDLDCYKFKSSVLLLVIINIVL